MDYISALAVRAKSDPEAMERLVREYMPFLTWKAKKLSFQEPDEALSLLLRRFVEAVAIYDPARACFNTVAYQVPLSASRDMRRLRRQATLQKSYDHAPEGPMRVDLSDDFEECGSFEIEERILDSLELDAFEATLTPRRQQVFALLRRGFNQSEVAAALGLSRTTIEHHFSRICNNALPLWA
jgi:RNA polymerase sigma factor (sigma-70 family)